MPKFKYKKRTDGRYYTQVLVGISPEGKRIVKNLYAKTSRELEEKVHEANAQIQKGIYKSKTVDTTFGEYTSFWNNVYNASKRTNTRAMYDNIIEKHIIPDVGHIPLCKITQSDLQGMINRRTEHPRTCQQILMVLKQIIRAAQNDGLMATRFLALKAPKYNPSKKRALTAEEKKAIKTAQFTDRERAFVQILFFFGLRREEALALTKSDFDFKKKTLNINKALVFSGNNPKIEQTKSSHSERCMHIPSSVIEQIKAYVSTIDTFYLFPKLDGKMITLSAYNSMWKNIVKKMNDSLLSENEKKLGVQKISGLTAHIFRHNYCTMLYYSDVSVKEAVRLMGHKDSKLIMDVYSHLDSSKECTEEKLDKIMNL